MRRDVGKRPGLAMIRMPLLAFGETTAQETARYLAEKMPVTETGRQLSLEQVPTVGLRNG
jgi:hypothetical protein